MLEWMRDEKWLGLGLCLFVCLLDGTQMGERSRVSVALRFEKNRRECEHVAYNIFVPMIKELEESGSKGLAPTPY